MQKLVKATNKQGIVVRDRMTESEFMSFLKYNTKRKYTIDCYSVENWKDRLIEVMKTITIILTFLGIGVLILEFLVRI